jgi:hypothetical protein
MPPDEPLLLLPPSPPRPVGLAPLRNPKSLRSDYRLAGEPPPPPTTPGRQRLGATCAAEPAADEGGMYRYSHMNVYGSPLLSRRATPCSWSRCSRRARSWAQSRCLFCPHPSARTRGCGGAENIRDPLRHLFQPFMVSLAALHAPLLA